MRNLTLLLVAIFIISCNRINKISEKEKSFLALQIDSLKQLNENLAATRSVLFENTLNLEETDKETAERLSGNFIQKHQHHKWNKDFQNLKG